MKILKIVIIAALFIGISNGAVAPVAGQPVELTWSVEEVPSTTGNLIGPTGIDIADLAVAADGTTIYAATGATVYSNTTGQGGLYKSTNTGTSWTDVALPNPAGGAASATNVDTSVDLLAVAPDDGNIVAIVADNKEVYVSTNGGTDWSNLGVVSNLANIYSIDISLPYAGARNIAVGGSKAGPAIAIAYFNFGAPVPSWTAIEGLAAMDSTVAARAVKFSPNYSSDRIMLAVTEKGTTDVMLELFNFHLNKWNDSGTGLSNYNGTFNKVASGAGIAPLQSASITLPSTYYGSDKDTRKGFIGIAANAAYAAKGGIYRTSDATAWGMKTTVNIRSVSYNAGIRKLVAGDFDSNAVYHCTNPLDSGPTVYTASLYKRPANYIDSDKAVVAWTGNNVIAGTSGPESAFSVSKDYGTSWNDISLIDTTLATIEDIAVSANGSKVYMLTDNGTYLSLWRRSSSWVRVLNLKSTSYIIRIAPENAAVVYVSKKGGTSIYYSNDSGETKWLLYSCNLVVQDMTIVSVSQLYALNAAGLVIKSTNAGMSWAASKATTLGSGHMIVSLSPSNLIVGGKAGTVAYSTDGNDSWTKISPIITAGNVQVTADGLAIGNNIYATTSAVNNFIYRWTIGSNTTEWTRITSAGALGAGFTVNGLVLQGGALYALASQGNTGGTTDSTLCRTLSPAISSAEITTTWSKVNTGADFVTAPRGLTTSTGSIKLWAIDTDAGAGAGEESATDTANDELYSYIDTLTTEGPTLQAPADGTSVRVNPITHRAYDVIFNWTSPSTGVTTYNLQIALDSSFTQIIRMENVASTDSTVVQILGPYSAGPSGNTFEWQAGATYYGRVRAAGPVLSTWSEVRHFKIEERVPTKPALSVPAIGAQDVPIQPAFVWSTVPGASRYLFELSDNFEFSGNSILEKTLDTNVYKSEAELEYSTTYYWRVRTQTLESGRVVTESPWVMNIFTTVAEPPPPPPEPTPPVTITSAPPAPKITLPPPVVNIPPAPEPTTPTWVWATISIIATLVIGVIYLIVRPRRSA